MDLVLRVQVVVDPTYRDVSFERCLLGAERLAGGVQQLDVVAERQERT
jgi:hypothetical protein